MSAMKLDRYDMNILRLLSQDGRISKSRLAEEVCLSVSATWERIKRLEQLGYIRGYKAVIDWDAVSKQSLVIVELTLDRHTAQQMRIFEERVMKLPEISRCYATGGGVDYVLHIKTESIDHYQRFIDRLLLENIGIERYFTYIVTKVIKGESHLPIDGFPGMTEPST